MEKEYVEILLKCKFISKKDQWFIEGSECVIIKESIWCDNFNVDTKFKDFVGNFGGLTMETYKGYLSPLPREDGEICPCDEFLIYDENKNEISELKLKEYLKLLSN